MDVSLCLPTSSIHNIWRPTWGWTCKENLLNRNENVYEFRRKRDVLRVDRKTRKKRNKKIREGHRTVAAKLKREAVISLKLGEIKVSSEVLAKLESISVTLKKKQECLAALDNEILEKCSMDEITKEIEVATETCAKIEETLLKIEACKNGSYKSNRTIAVDNSASESSPQSQHSIEMTTLPRMEIRQVNSPTNSQSRSGSSAIPNVGV